MKIKTLILGFGITGESCLKYLNSLNKTCRIFDTRTKEELKNIKQYTDTKNEFYFSEYNDEILKEIDTVIISPGFEPNHPLISQIRYKGIPIQTDIDLFKSSYDGKIISVTGTNGKTTVVQMLEKILISLGKKARACGNNGVPPLNLINEKLDYAIVELSSYQLEYMVDKSSDISILLNITDDHLDRHETFERYSKIKMGIFDNIGKKIINISLKKYINSDDVKYFGYIQDTSTIIINSEKKDNLYINNETLHYDGISLNFMGYHTLQNILAVLSVMDCLKINFAKCLTALMSFTHPPHRIELVKRSNNISWYNDSKSTNCDSTYWALKSLRQNVILIMGGSAKKQDFSLLSKVIDDTVKILILTGKNSRAILGDLNVSVKIFKASDMNDAVKIANNHATENDSVILSPASPSFDFYQDYKHRGKVFTNAVLKIAD